MILVAALFILDFILLWMIALARRAWWVPVICVTFLVVLLNWYVIGAFSSGTGWAKSGLAANNTYQFLGCDVVPPSGNDKGAIYLLLVPPQQIPRIGFKSAINEPRLFSVPFSPALAAQCQKAEKAGQQGQQISLKAKPQKGKHGQANNLRHMKLEFYKNANGSFPPKP